MRNRRRRGATDTRRLSANAASVAAARSAAGQDESETQGRGRRVQRRGNDLVLPLGVFGRRINEGAGAPASHEGPGPARCADAEPGLAPSSDPVNVSEAVLADPPTRTVTVGAIFRRQQRVDVRAGACRTASRSRVRRRRARQSRFQEQRADGHVPCSRPRCRSGWREPRRRHVLAEHARFSGARCAVTVTAAASPSLREAQRRARHRSSTTNASRIVVDRETPRRLARRWREAAPRLRISSRSNNACCAVLRRAVASRRAAQRRDARRVRLRQRCGQLRVQRKSSAAIARSSRSASVMPRAMSRSLVATTTELSARIRPTSKRAFGVAGLRLEDREGRGPAAASALTLEAASRARPPASRR